MVNKRIIIKISGEMLGGKGNFSFATFQRLTQDIKQLQQSGCKIGVVVGGGNICRGRDLRRIEKVQADWMGMIATLINGLLLKYYLEKNKIRTEIFSGVEVAGIAQLFNLYQARHLYNQGYVLILVFGTGNPAFTTDTAAAVRAVELGAHIIIKGTKVDGVYDRDPVRYKNAKFYPRLTYDEAIIKKLGVLDLTAFSLCAEHKIKIRIFNFHKHSISELLSNPKIGSTIS